MNRLVFLQRSRLIQNKKPAYLVQWLMRARGTENVPMTMTGSRTRRCQTQYLDLFTGIIERAVSWVINRRIKKRGMRWRRRNATALVALRVTFLNTDWQQPSLARTFP